METENKLDPIVQLDAIAKATPRQFAFTAKTQAAAKRWQTKARAALKKTLGFVDQKKVSLQPHSRSPGRSRVVSSAEGPPPNLAAFRHADVYLDPQAIQRAISVHARAARAWLRGARHRRHSAGQYGARTFPMIITRTSPSNCVKRGFLVDRAGDQLLRRARRRLFAPGRISPPQALPQCKYLRDDARRIGRGATRLGWHAQVDYLATLPQADVSRLGVMGISGGGMHAFFSACLDLRIKAAVISGYFCDWRHSILAINHCTCNFVPGLLKLGELSDLAGIIAPRPLLVENGDEDEIFPIDAVKATVKKATRTWKAFGTKPIETDFFHGGHRIHGEKGYPFLARHLYAGS